MYIFGSFGDFNFGCGRPCILPSPSRRLDAAHAQYLEPCSYQARDTPLPPNRSHSEISMNGGQVHLKRLGDDDIRQINSEHAREASSSAVSFEIADNPKMQPTVSIYSMTSSDIFEYQEKLRQKRARRAARAARALKVRNSVRIY